MAENGQNGEKMVKLGVSTDNYWLVNSKEVNLAPPPAPQILVKFPTEDQTVTIDVRRSALVIVDMQNEWCSKDGWTGARGRDYSYASKLVGPLGKLIPNARSRGMKIIWLNWGIRSDCANIPPNQFWCYNPSGEGLGVGDKMPSGCKFLEKNTWSSDIIDGLKETVSPDDIHVEKCRFSGFWDTNFDVILRNLGIRTLIFTGVCTDQCVHHTLADANFLGYSCILLKDLVGTNSPDFVRDATFWQIKSSFGFIANSEDFREGLEKIGKLEISEYFGA